MNITPAAPPRLAPLFVPANASRAYACKDRGFKDLKASTGKDMWLFGGVKAFRSLAEAKVVDMVEVSVMPILLGGGFTLAPSLSKWVNLSLVNHKVYSSGAVSLEYSVDPIECVRLAA